MRLVLAVLLVLTSPLAYAIQVDGEGRTLEQALNNAFKVAIDNEVGVILDTERHLKNGKVTHNQILSYSAGYVTSYTILHHIHIRDMDCNFIRHLHFGAINCSFCDYIRHLSLLNCYQFSIFVPNIANIVTCQNNK